MGVCSQLCFCFFYKKFFLCNFIHQCYCASIEYNTVMYYLSTDVCCQNCFVVWLPSIKFPTLLDPCFTPQQKLNNLNKYCISDSYFSIWKSSLTPNHQNFLWNGTSLWHCWVVVCELDSKEDRSRMVRKENE